jgi:peptidoglycan/LPS O-acetylase OafA/YrhL
MPGVNALRALAIVLVVLYHLGQPFSGSLGVNAFFVMSGFLITSILLREFRETGDISFRNFYRRRAFRIFPTFYLCWIATTIVFLLQHKTIRIWEAIASFFYAADYGRAFLPLDRQLTFHMSISWSLAIEEQFYLLWPLLLLYLLRKPAQIKRTLGIIILAVWVWRAVLMLGFGVSWLYVYNAFDTRIDSILVGSFLAILVQEDQAPEALVWWLRSQWLALIPVFLLVASSARDLHPSTSDAVQLINFTLQPVVLMILVIQWIYWGHSSWGVMRWKPVTYLAKISYALYLYHAIVLMIRPRISFIKQRPTELILMFLMACASYHLVEKPFMEMRDRGAKAKREALGSVSV